KRHMDYKDKISPNINDGKPKKRCIDDKDDNITTMDTIKNVSLLVLSTGDAFTNYVPILKTICDLYLQFNVILSSYHTMKQQDNNMEKYFAKIYEKFENLETTMQNSELVLIKNLSKYVSSDNLELNPIDTDVRGANKRVVKKILRKTVEVACKTILHYPKDDGTSESKKFQAKLAILNAIQSWEHSPHNRPSFDEIKNELAESWKCFENTKYVAKFIAKDEVSNDKIQHHNIDKDSDFKVVKKTLFESPIPLDEGVKAYKGGKYQRAWKCFCENAELNNYNAIYWKAYYLQHGEETGKASQEDKEKAIELYKIAADNGIAKAQYNYASLIYEKDKVANLKEFKKYLQLAAENGYEVALHFLGVCYFEGAHGYEKDHDQAIDYLKCVTFQNHNEQISWDATNIINQINKIRG
ncbi:23923_t:CDS:2, partial [Entrophospora sp. SA101]